MAGKNWLTVAREGPFGTFPGTGFYDLGVTDLGGHTPTVAVQAPEVMRRGQVTPTMDGMRTVTRGGTGTIKPHLATRGMLDIFAAAIGTPSEAPVGGLTRYTFDLDETAPTVSLAVQAGREFKGGTQDKDSFAGGQAAVLRLAQGLSANTSGVSAEGIPTVELDVNYQKFLPNQALVENSTILDAVNFSGADCTIWLGPDLDDLDEECLNEFALELPTGFDFEDRCISTVARDEAGRAGMIAPTLTLGWSYKNRTYYDAWVNGTPMALRVRWELTVDGDDFGVQLDVPALMFTGDVPAESMTETTKQQLPAAIYGTYDELGDPVPALSILVDTDEVWDES